ncbi:MAG: four helix bundle protein [bacterium]
MKFDRFEDIVIWQKSKKLTTALYKFFDTSKDYNFKNQILRAAISIMNNIAEGFERKSNNEFKHFLFMAKGSAGEIRSMLCLGLELQYLTEEEFLKFKNDCEVISKMLSALIKAL